MTPHKDIVRTYFDGFRKGDHAQILDLLTDDVVWEIHGHRSLRGKQEFDAEIENDAFEGRPVLAIVGLIEDGDVVVAPHRGEARWKGGGALRFAGVTVFTFEGALISRVESYVVPIGGADES